MGGYDAFRFACRAAAVDYDESMVAGKTCVCEFIGGMGCAQEGLEGDCTADGPDVFAMSLQMRCMACRYEDDAGLPPPGRQRRQDLHHFTQHRWSRAAKREIRSANSHSGSTCEKWLTQPPTPKSGETEVNTAPMDVLARNRTMT